MAKLLKLRRGTTSQHSSFTGAEGEVTVDTDKETLVVHNGSTAGGFPVARADGTGTANFTITGELDAATGDFSGDVDVDGTLEADAITVNGTALNTVIAGVTVSNATNAATATEATNITAVANNSANETVYPTFVDGATGTQGIETDTGLTYNPSTGLLSAAAVTTTGNVTVGGNLQVDGTTTTVNSSTMTVTDKNIEIAKGAANDAAADGAGITVDSGDGDKTWNWVDATDAWTSSEHIHLGDDKKFIAGTGSDLQIYNDGNSRIHNTNNGENLILQSDYMTFRTNQVNEYVFVSVPNGEVQLFHNGIKTFETYSSGIIVRGTESGNGDIYLYADEGDDNADKWNLKALTDGTFTIGNKTSGSWETNIKAVGDAQVELNYNDSKKFETTNDGAKVTGEFQMGGTAGVKFAHSGTSSIYESQTAGDELLFKTTPSGGASTTALTISSAQNATFAGTLSDADGDVRKVKVANKTSAYTLTADDTGRLIYISTGGVTNNNSVMSGNEIVTIINNSGSDQTITQGSGMTMYNTADASSGNRTLAGRGMATIWFASASISYISGAGLS
jgi:hypothetical protein